MAIRDLAAAAGISHSAASQTVARMKQLKLVETAQGADGRERAIRLSRRGKALLPKLQVRWEATNAAADELDRELSQRLTRCVEEAIAALQTRSFKQRIRANEQRLLRKVSR
jgi:DNA-binding MarR family transcriptional regulator